MTLEQAREWLQRHADNTPMPGTQEAYKTILDALNVARRGKWGCYEPLSDGYRCSSCKLTHRSCTAYCPNCGAKMEVQNEHPG